MKTETRVLAEKTRSELVKVQTQLETIFRTLKEDASPDKNIEFRKTRPALREAIIAIEATLVELDVTLNKGKRLSTSELYIEQSQLDGCWYVMVPEKQKSHGPFESYAEAVYAKRSFQ